MLVWSYSKKGSFLVCSPIILFLLTKKKPLCTWPSSDLTSKIFYGACKVSPNIRQFIWHFNMNILSTCKKLSCRRVPISHFTDVVLMETRISRLEQLRYYQRYARICRGVHLALDLVFGLEIRFFRLFRWNQKAQTNYFGLVQFGSVSNRNVEINKQLFN